MMAIRKDLLQLNEEFQLLWWDNAGKVRSERDSNSGSCCMGGPRR